MPNIANTETSSCRVAAPLQPDSSSTLYWFYQVKPVLFLSAVLCLSSGLGRLFSFVKVGDFHFGFNVLCI